MHIVKFALRFLSRQKAFTFINILGLALSLACCIVLSRYLYREITAESHAKDIETIIVPYRISDVYGTHLYTDLSDLRDMYKKDFRDELGKVCIESCKFITGSEKDFSCDKRNINVSTLVVDSLFLNFFDYNIEGDRNAMYRPDGCWISRKLLARLGFSVQEAIGKPIVSMGQNLVIAGIFDTPKTKSIYNPDVIISHRATNSWTIMGSEWMRVPKGFDLKAWNEKMHTFEEKEDSRIVWRDNTHENQFLAWKDFYMRPDMGDYDDASELHGDKSVDTILAIVMLLILIVGITNFINLYLVYWQKRQREEGVRRVFGQKGFQLFAELWTELFCITAAAVLFTWLLVEITAPTTNELLRDELAYSNFDWALTACILIVLPLVTLVFPMHRSLQGSVLSKLQIRSGSIQSLRMRTFVLGFQYLITFSLVVMALWMQHHLDFLLNSPIGFEYENVIIAKPLRIYEGYGRDAEGNPTYNSNRREAYDALTIIKDRLKESTNFEACEIINYTPLMHGNHYYDYVNEKGDEIKALKLQFTPDWLDVFGVKITEGKLFLNDNPDIKDPCYDKWVVNETALKALGYNSIDSAYAQSVIPLSIHYDYETKSTVKDGIDLVPIVGVLNDFYSQHRTLGLVPTFFHITPGIQFVDNITNLAIRVKDGHKQAAVDELKKICSEVCPNDELYYHWYKDDVEAQYNDDRLLARIYTLFSGIAIIICCLGLLGLSLFDIRQRYREIAIRKAIGAHRKELYLLLARKYLYVIAVTFALSIPITYSLVHRYTESFIESASLNALIYIEALCIVILITALTLIYQLERAARINVSEVMKTE